MLIVDTDNNILEEYDSNLGYIKSDSVDVYYMYIDDSWHITDMNENILPWPINIETKFFPLEQKVPDTLQIGIYHLYTQEELDEIELAKQEYLKRKEFFKTGPGRLDVAEENIDISYDAIAELGTIAEDHSLTLDDIMDAIAELGQIVEANNG